MSDNHPEKKSKQDIPEHQEQQTKHDVLAEHIALSPASTTAFSEMAEKDPGLIASLEERKKEIEARWGEKENKADYSIQERYLSDLGVDIRISHEEELDIMKKVAKNNPIATEHIVKAHLHLVVKIARCYLNRGLPFLDLVEEGNMGLMHAIRKFDLSKEVRVSTYATWWIRQNIERAIMNQTRIVRLPIHVIKEMSQCLRASRQVAAREFQQASLTEIAKEMGMSIEKVRSTMSLKADAISFERPIYQESTVSLGDTVSYDDDHLEDPGDIVAEYDLVHCIEELLDDLSDLEYKVIVRRYGLKGHQPSTLKEIADSTGMTKERIRLTQHKTVEKLKRLALAKTGLNDHNDDDN